MQTVHGKLQTDSKQKYKFKRAEIKEVKSMFAAFATHQDIEEKKESRPGSIETVTETSLDTEKVAGKKQVKQLQQKVN